MKRVNEDLKGKGRRVLLKLTSDPISLDSDEDLTDDNTDNLEVGDRRDQILVTLLEDARISHRREKGERNGRTA